MAIDNFSEAIKASQYNAKSYLSRGNVYAKIGDYKQAIADFEKADQVQIPRDDVVLPRIHLSLGNAHAKSENYDEAIKIFEHAIRILPDFQDPSGWRPSTDDIYNIASALYNSRGNVYAKIGEDNQAIADFNKAIESEKHNYLPYLNLSKIYMKMNKHERSIKCYDKLIATMAKSNFAPYLCRGHSYVKISKYEEAIADFNEAIKSLKTRWYRVLVFLFRGHFYAKFGNFKNTIDNFCEAVRLQQLCHKWIVAAFYNRHNVYLKIDNAEKAAEDFNEAKELDPELTKDSRPRFLFPLPVLVRQPDIYLCPALHNWEVDLSPNFEE